MKTKTFAIITAAVLIMATIGAGIYHANSSKLCPLGQAIHDK